MLGHVLAHVMFCPILTGKNRTTRFNHGLRKDMASQYGIGSDLSSKIMIYNDSNK